MDARKGAFVTHATVLPSISGIHDSRLLKWFSWTLLIRLTYHFAPWQGRAVTTFRGTHSLPLQSGDNTDRSWVHNVDLFPKSIRKLRCTAVTVPVFTSSNAEKWLSCFWFRRLATELSAVSIITRDGWFKTLKVSLQICLPANGTNYLHATSYAASVKCEGTFGTPCIISSWILRGRKKEIKISAVKGRKIYIKKL